MVIILYSVVVEDWERLEADEVFKKYALMVE